MAVLTLKQTAFVEAYLANGRDGAAAYRTAYGPKTTKATAQVEAHRLIKHPLIAPILAEAEAKAHARTADLTDRYAITRANILREMSRIAFTSPRDALKWGQQGVVLTDSDELSDDVAAAVAEVSETNGEGGRTLKVKFHAKFPALVQLGKHLSMWDNQPADDDALARIADDADPPRIDRGEA